MPKRSVALIADVVRSRRFHGRQREDLQQTIETLLATLNDRYDHAILSKFIVTTGDEFQALLADATAIPNIIWDLEAGLQPVDVRIGIGCGDLHTSLREYAVGMDGPVWHRAREAVLQARKRRGGVFVGFGSHEDTVLNGLARLLHFLRRRLKTRQREALSVLRHEPTLAAVDLAERHQVTRQAASSTIRSAGWTAFREGEEAWRATLRRFDFSKDWRSKK